MESGEKLQWKKFKTCKSNYSRNELISRYTNFVKVVAHEIYRTLPNTFEFADLENYGYMGLMDAIEKFDPERNIKFETYAKFRIKGAIIDGLRKIDWFSRAIRDNMKKNNHLRENMQDLDNSETGFLADSPEFYKNSKNDNFNYVIMSYEDLCAEGGDFFQVDEASGYSHYNAFINPDDFVENLENASYISKALRKLKDTEKKVVFYHYFKGRTFKEIGTAIGVSESRASQIHKKALGSLKRIMR
jgi:RNA polymerase sigma factor FliA